MHCGKWPRTKATKTTKEAWKRQGLGDGKGDPTRPCVLSVWLWGGRSPPFPSPKGPWGRGQQHLVLAPVVQACTHRQGSRHWSPLFHPPGSTSRPTVEEGGTAGAGASSGAAPVGTGLVNGGLGGPAGQPGPISWQGGRASWTRAWRGSSVLSGGQNPMSFHALHAGGRGSPKRPMRCLRAVNH